MFVFRMVFKTSVSPRMQRAVALAFRHWRHIRHAIGNRRGTPVGHDIVQTHLRRVRLQLARVTEILEHAHDCLTRLRHDIGRQLVSTAVDDAAGTKHIAFIADSQVDRQILLMHRVLKQADIHAGRHAIVQVHAMRRLRHQRGR